MDEIMVVKQLPIITERLILIKNDIEKEVAEALSWECTADTVGEVKKLRADLNKRRAELESKRKEVKKKILAPYEAFESIYKENVSDILSLADEKLKIKIDAVENELKAEKKAEVEEYFNEYAAANGIDFIKFAVAGIDITMSATKKKLKEQAKAFIDNIADGIKLIESMDNYNDEIMVEFKRSLNASSAIRVVNERHALVEEQKRKRAEAEERKENQKINQLQKIQEQLKAPVIENDNADKLFKMTFTVTASRQTLKKLKDFMDKEGIKYE